MIHSLLDTDLYKFTMMQAVLHRFPAAEVEYRFKCRSPGIDLRPCMDAIDQRITALCALRFSEDELDYLAGLRYLKPDFIDFLRLFQLQRRYIELYDDGEQLALTLRGPWLHTILFEVPLLAIINQCWFEHQHPGLDPGEGQRRLQEKIALVRDYADTDSFHFADFGTRRRFSADWQRQVVEQLASALPGQFTGSSNVLLAKQFTLTPIGTMAHEYLQACQALGPRLADSQKFAFDSWAQEYRGDLGIALSDVVGLDAFLRDFDLYFCKLFDGARHDSGDPFDWAERVIAHYRQHRIDPRHKQLVFSDGLDIPTALAIHARFHQQAGISFGIGTNLSNDLGPTALSIVIKMTTCNGQPVAKLSDSPGKAMLDNPTYTDWLQQAFASP